MSDELLFFFIHSGFSMMKIEVTNRSDVIQIEMEKRINQVLENTKYAWYENNDSSMSN